MADAAIVTTLKSQGPSLLTFVNYHLAIGFSKIYLMFDDPNDPDRFLVQGIPGVEAIACDQSLREQWKPLHKFRQYGNHIEAEVRARQVLNAELAMQKALVEEIDWLLHIDSDELYWVPEESIDPHLARLEEMGVVSARYLNYEAIPHTESIDNYFLEVTKFKKPRKLLGKQEIDIGKIWPRNRKYFNFYVNGKSMARVRDDMVPNDVHKWTSKTEYISVSRFYQPCILHYSCCGYQYFESKFKKLADNGNVGIEFGVSVKEKGFSLDYDALSAYLNKDEKTALQIYRDRVMMSEEAIVLFEQQGVVLHCDIKTKLNARQSVLD